ncbi:DUF2336 domain-containing protein [Embleya sp. NBC_00888]|uniref:hypothetical protein n=1 Tax=Embleya sp. NBC_00888 TaxID=2975960 RepID=UPI003866CBA6|nr:DUF2336 domain-containing protein [Embleya sp. NBC_00888]
MGDAVHDLLWHTGPEVGAELIDRLGAPAPESPDTGPRARRATPPPLIAYRLRHGVAAGLVGRHGKGRPPGTPGNPELLLRLLERDDPELNATLYRESEWAGLRRAILSQRAHRPGAPADALVPLDPSLRTELTTTTHHAHLEPALWARDPDLALWALLAHPNPEPLAALAARITLLKAGQTARLRTVSRLTRHPLPADLSPALQRELGGAHMLRGLPKYLAKELSPETLVRRARGTTTVGRARSVVAGVPIPDWSAVAAAHRAEPLPWHAVAAFAEHPRCPSELLVEFTGKYPQTIEVIPVPPAELLAACVAEGSDSRTKTVLLRRLATSAADLGELLAVRPARLLLTALDQGPVSAVANQAELAYVLGRTLRAHLDRTGPALWPALYTALPTLNAPVHDLFAEAEATATATAETKTQRAATAAAAAPTPTPLPRPGRQAAWAYTVLIDLAGTADDATAFLDDAHLAPLAGTGTLPAFLAERLAGIGGPITLRVLAGNPHTPRAILDRLAGHADPAITAAVYRNSRATDAQRRLVLAAPELDPTLRQDLLSTDDPVLLRTLLAARDPGLLRALALRDDPPLDRTSIRTQDARTLAGRVLRLHAALRLAETSGVPALVTLPEDPEITAALHTGRTDPLRVALAESAETSLRALESVREWEQHSPLPKAELTAALIDPAPDWPALTEAVRAGRLCAWIRGALGRRPDVSEPFARAVAERDPTGRHLSPHHDVPAGAPGRTHPYRPHLIGLFDSGALTVERHLAETPAVEVLDAAPGWPRLARVVARHLREHLGTDTRAWVVAAHLARGDVEPTLIELAATSSAAAGGAPDRPSGCRSALGSSNDTEGR